MKKFIEDETRFMMSDPAVLVIRKKKESINNNELSEVADFMKQNYNCPESEKTGSGKGSCGGKEESNKSNKITSAKFETGGDAGADGQYDGYIVARDPKTGKKLGYLDYSYLNGEYAIQMIETEKDHQRKGVATLLINELKKTFDKGDKLTMQGTFATKEGQAFMKSIGIGKENRMPITGITYNPGLKSVGIHISNNNIQVGPSFFDGNKSEQEYVITHELAHGLADIVTENRSKEYGYAETFDDDVNTLTINVEFDDAGNRHNIFAFEHTRLEEAKADVLTEFAMDPDKLREMDINIYDWAYRSYKEANVDPEQMIEQAKEFVTELEIYNPNNNKKSKGI